MLDTLIGVTDIARSGRSRPPAEMEPQQLAPGSRALGHLETRLAGVVVAALREAFDRDSHRLELEREQLAAERQRAERAMRLELQRHAVDREIGRLRLLAGIAVTAWFATLLLSTRVIAGGPGARLSL